MLTFNGKLTTYCNGLVELNASNGTFSDGSDTSNYNINSICRWRIYLPTISTININFNSFDLASDIDFLRIYDEVANTLVASYTYTSPPQSLTIVTNDVLLFFKTNGIYNGQGWEINYTSTPLAVQENEGSYLSIGPNPANEFLNIETNLQDNKEVSIDMLNSLGQIVLSKKVNCEGDKLKVKLDVSSLANGIYFLRLSGENIRKTQKFTIQ